jgi:hypothetical protein
MTKTRIVLVSALVLAGAVSPALAQQSPNSPGTSVPTPSGGPIGSSTATPGATTGVNPNTGMGSSSAGGSGGTSTGPTNPNGPSPTSGMTRPK